MFAAIYRLDSKDPCLCSITKRTTRPSLIQKMKIKKKLSLEFKIMSNLSLKFKTKHGFSKLICKAIN